jgi:hypothetical protein
MFSNQTGRVFERMMRGVQPCGASRTCVPMTREEYNRIWNDAGKARRFLPPLIEDHQPLPSISSRDTNSADTYPTECSASTCGGCECGTMLIPCAQFRDELQVWHGVRSEVSVLVVVLGRPAPDCHGELRPDLPPQLQSSSLRRPDRLPHLRSS